MDAGRRRFHVADAAADALTQANEKRPRENAGDGGASYGMQFRATFIGGAARGRTDLQSVHARNAISCYRVVERICDPFMHGIHFFVTGLLNGLRVRNSAWCSMETMSIGPFLR